MLYKSSDTFVWSNGELIVQAWVLTALFQDFDAWFNAEGCMDNNAMVARLHNVSLSIILLLMMNMSCNSIFLGEEGSNRSHSDVPRIERI